MKIGSTLLILLLATLAACGDNGASDADNGGGGNAPTYTVGGTVAGLKGSGLQVSNGLTTLTISADGAFAFPIALTSGTAYTVTVATQPSSPAQVCTVTGAKGTLATSNVTNVAVTCTTTTTTPPPATTHTVGGVVSNLSGSGLELNDGTEDLAITADGAFTFPTALTSGAQYNVTVVTQPSTPAQVCAISQGSGTVATSNVTNIAIACTTTTTASLSLSSSTPASGATDVSRRIAPVLTFSAQVDDTTVSASSVTLVTAAGASQSITLQTSFDQLTVTPTSKLAPLTSYTLTVGTGVHGAAGQPLDGPVSVTFTTGDKSWQTAGLIETQDAAPSLPRIAGNASGSAVAVWTQSDGTLVRVWANHYTPGSGWGTAVPIHSDPTGNASAPQVAIDAQGNALAVWVQTFSNGLSYLESSRYTGGWAGAGSVETDNAGDASDPQIAFDANGNALVVWTRYQSKIWSVGRPAGGGWNREVQIEAANPVSIAAKPQIAVNASGNALAVWNENDSSQHIMANRYTAGSGWGTAGAIATNTDSVFPPQIAIDTNGDGLAVWRQITGSQFDIVSNRYTPGSGWRTARSITTDKTHDAADPQIAFDTNGNALAVWAQAATNANGIIWTDRYPAAGSDWDTAAPLGTVIPFANMQTPQIAFDANGNALAVWQQYIQGQDKARNIAASRFSAAGTWGTPALIETDDAGDASTPQIAVDANGNALAVWQQSDGTRNNIVANRFE